MDSVYRHQRHFYNFTRRYYLVGRDRLIRELDLLPGERAVEVGCGTGRNLIAIARRYPLARLYGIDASSLMLETAARAIARAGVGGRVALAAGYAEELSPVIIPEATGFDRVIFSYSLSMIPDWERALAAADRACVPNGRIHIVDFGDFSGLGRLGAWGLRLWLRHFHVEPRTEFLRMLERGPRAAADTFWMAPGRYAFLWSGRRFPGS